MDGNKLGLILRVYENVSVTELEITRDRSNVYLDYISGSKEYNADLELIKPGEYKIVVVASGG